MPVHGGKRDEFFEPLELPDDQCPLSCDAPSACAQVEDKGWFQTDPMDRRTRHIDDTVPSPAETPHPASSRSNFGKQTGHA